MVGAILGKVEVGMFLAGAGSLAGYGLWVRARLAAIRERHKPFHLGSVLNIFVCTAIAVGVGITCVLAALIESSGVRDTISILAIVFLVSALAIGLHWKAAKDAGAVQWFPSGEEIGREALHTVLAEELPVAAAEVGVAAVRGAQGAAGGHRH